MKDDYDWTPHLQEGERVLWQGRPDQRFRVKLTSNDGLFLFVVGFIGSVLLFAAILGATSLISGWEEFGGFIAAILMTILVAALGLQPAMTDKRRRERYRYAISDRRALRLDAITRNVLTERHLEPGTMVDLIGRTPKTVRVGPWAKNGRPLWAVMPDNRNGFQPKGSGLIAGMFERRQTLKATIPSQGFKTGGDGIQSFNGYDDVGLEFRMIHDAESVAALLRKMIATKNEAAHDQHPPNRRVPHPRQDL